MVLDDVLSLPESAGIDTVVYYSDCTGWGDVACVELWVLVLPDEAAGAVSEGYAVVYELSASASSSIAI